MSAQQPALLFKQIPLDITICSINKSSAFLIMLCLPRSYSIIRKESTELKEVTRLGKDEPSFKNRDRFIQLGIVIAAMRKMRGMSQEQLAEKANISRSHLSALAAPNLVRAFSLDIFFNIADALEVDPSELIKGKLFSDDVLK